MFDPKNCLTITASSFKAIFMKSQPWPSATLRSRGQRSMDSCSYFDVSNLPNAAIDEKDGRGTTINKLPRFLCGKCRSLFTGFCSSAYFSVNLGLGGASRAEVGSLKFGSSADETVKSTGLSVPELSTDVIQEIVNRCDTFKDFIACAKVSILWRYACSCADWNRSPQLPSLMLSEKANSEKRCFFSPYHKRTTFELALPAARGKRIWGSPHGWIITLDDKLQVHVLNLISQLQLQLPPLPAIEPPHLARDMDWFRMMHKSFAFKITHAELLIAVILHRPNHLCFLRLPAGDHVEWLMVRNPNNFIFKDVAYLNGQLYALCDNGSVVGIEFIESLAATTHFIASSPEGETAERVYLVNSLDSLFGIFRYDENVEYGMTTEFVVYKLNMESKMWEEMWSIGDSAFFVGNGNSWGISSAARVNYKKNSIYFTNDNWEEDEGHHEITGVYDMEIWETEYLTTGAADHPLTQYSRPAWVAHGLTPTFFT